MKREIKFRAFETEKARGRMFYWDEIKNEFISYLNCKETFVMQYTGLTDKEGVEVYEGDIFMLSEGHPHWISKKMEIVFFRGSFCIKVIGVDYLIKTPTSFLNYFDACEDYGLVEPFERFIKVIGNIHQSPELLNQK